MRRAKILRALYSPVWAITDEQLAELKAMADDEALPMEEPKDEAEKAPDSVFLARVHGPMVGRGNWVTRIFGLRSYDEMAESVRAARLDPSIKSAVFDFNSGGGDCAGLSELADEITALSAVKPTVAVVSHIACSAAYYLAAQCGRIVASDQAMVGSIGTIIIRPDFSKAAERDGIKLNFITAGKNKAEGSAFRPMSDSEKAHLTSIVESAQSRFVSAVARGRKVSEETVRSEAWGQGRVIFAPDALANGMVDEIGNLSSVVDGMVSGSMKVALKSVVEHVEAPLVPVASTAQFAELMETQAAVALSEAVDALANSENPLDNPDTRQAAAEEIEMNEEKLNELLAAVAGLGAKVDAAQAEAKAAREEAQASREALVKAQADSHAETISASLERFVAEGRITPAEAQSEATILAEVKPETAKARLTVLAQRKPDFANLSAQVFADDEGKSLEGFDEICTPQMAANDPAAARIMRDAFIKAGGDKAKMDKYFCQAH